MNQSHDKKLERKAKNMILQKEISENKMEAVRALLKNTGLKDHEKYSAVIQLIQECPNKPLTEERLVKPRKAIEVDDNQRFAARDQAVQPQPVKTVSGPTRKAVHVDELNNKYKKHGLFRKKWLISANTPLKFWFKKRLVPTKKCVKVFQKIAAYQQLMMTRLPRIMDEIVKDPEIESPLIYNYLRVFRQWMMETPFVKRDYGELILLDSVHFQNELAAWVNNYFSFAALDPDTKENIILTVENKLRNFNDLKKQPSITIDSDRANLKSEKVIYEYMMTLRSFIPSGIAGEGTVDRFLSSSTGLGSIDHFITVVLSALVFRHVTDRLEINSYFEVLPLSVNSTKWDCSNEELKKAGKDQASIKKYRLDQYRKEIEPYNGLVEFINHKVEGRSLLSKAFDEHWHIINKRRQDYGDYQNDNFFFYIDDCVNYFIQTYLPFLDGSPRRFLDSNKQVYESSIFNIAYFERNINVLYDIQRDLVDYRTNNPNSVISEEEIKRIMQGRLATMMHIKSYIEHIGSLFYSFASRLHDIYIGHINWITGGEKTPYPDIVRTPLLPTVVDKSEESDNNHPIPFYDCQIAMQDNLSPILKNLVGTYVLNDSLKGGLFKNIIAFCYQMAYECMDKSVIRDLKRRRDLRKKIEELQQ